MNEDYILVKKKEEFIRTDNNVVGYTVPPNNHINFVNKSASTYNWTHYKCS